MYDPPDPDDERAARPTKDRRRPPRAIAGLSGLGGRPRLHPSWREPDPDGLPDPAAPAPSLVLRSKDEPDDG